MRRFLRIVLLAAATIPLAAPALAEGAQLEPSVVRVEAGTQIELTAHLPADDVEDGPFFAYLSGPDYGAVVTMVPGGAATDVPIGEVQIETSETDAQVSVVVTIPAETPPGEYEIVICNDPCTSGLAGLNGGTVYVGMDASSPSTQLPASGATTGAVDVLASSTSDSTSATNLALGQHPERTTQISPLWIAFPAVLGAVVLVMALLGRNRA